MSIYPEDASSSKSPSSGADSLAGRLQKALGPVAVVSPLAAGDGAIVVLIGVFLFGETLALGHFAAIALLVVGVVLAATDLRELRRGMAVPSKGPLFGLITMVGVEVNSVLHPVNAVRPAPASAAAPPNLAPDSARPPRRGVRGRTLVIATLVASGIGLLLGRRTSGKV